MCLLCICRSQTKFKIDSVYTEEKFAAEKIGEYAFRVKPRYRCGAFPENTTQLQYLNIRMFDQLYSHVQCGCYDRQTTYWLDFLCHGLHRRPRCNDNRIIISNHRSCFLRNGRLLGRLYPLLLKHGPVDGIWVNQRGPTMGAKKQLPILK